MNFFNKLTYKDSAYWQALLENEILVKSNLMELINTLSTDPVAKAIKDSIVSNLAGGDNMVDFPKDVKTIDVIDLDPKRPDAFSVQYTKPDGKVITQQIKIGKLVTKLMKSFKPEQIEEFVKYINAFRTDLKDSGVLFEVVKGEDIRKYYLDENYERGRGSLNKSCMRYKKCQPWFDIYVFNPKQVKMLVKFNAKKEVSGRALLWKLDSGKKYMDRIYVNDNKDEAIFKKWGQENGVDQFFGNWDEAEVTIPEMKKIWEMVYYPYMDTFQFGVIGAGNSMIFSNEEESREWRFQETDGGHTFDGYNEDGYNEDGYDENGYDEDDYDKNGYDKNGYDEDGYDKDGYDKNGDDEDGNNRDGS